MPGLIRGVVRTAAVAGTATAVSNRVSRRQAGRWAEQEQQYDSPPQQYAQPAPVPAPSPPADDMGSRLEHLEQLGELRDKGMLSDAEFEEQKRRLLAG